MASKVKKTGNLNPSIDKGFKLLQHYLFTGISLLEDFLGLFYPRVCSGCDASLRKHEENLCLLCRHQLPLTYYWDYDTTPVEKLFWGRIPVSRACSFLHFEQDNVVQTLMHRLKYEGKTAIGSELGLMFGEKLLEKGWFGDIDVIVPVPLHRTKESRRGYNQSNFIAEGLAQSLNIPVSREMIFRVKASSTQTKKSRFDRTENVDDVFKVIHKKVEGKNILLVDDVVTTGATLTAAGARFIEAGARTVSVATIAVA